MEKLKACSLCGREGCTDHSVDDQKEYEYQKLRRFRGFNRRQAEKDNVNE